MSAKPTPGPYWVNEGTTGAMVSGAGGKVAWFSSEEVSPEEAIANAHAWVDGMAAIAKLERIEQILRDTGAGKLSPWKTVVAIGKIVIEAKP